MIRTSVFLFASLLLIMDTRVDLYMGAGVLTGTENTIQYAFRFGHSRNWKLDVYQHWKRQFKAKGNS